MAFDKFDNILKHKKGRQKIYKAAWICYYGQKEIDQIFKGRDIIVASFKNDTLNCDVPNSILAQEVRIKSDELKNKINEKLRGNLIKRVRTKIKR